VSREWIVLTQVYDLLAIVNSGKKKPKPYPTPWPAEGSNRIGSKTNLSGVDVMRRLDSMNPRIENGE
jgi:hypothetical protein